MLCTRASRHTLYLHAELQAQMMEMEKKDEKRAIILASVLEKTARMQQSASEQHVPSHGMPLHRSVLCATRQQIKSAPVRYFIVERCVSCSQFPPEANLIEVLTPHFLLPLHTHLEQVHQRSQFAP